ncbi:MAG: hypothetical protein ABFD52_04965 [Acidobacteriota bacterium]
MNEALSKLKKLNDAAAAHAANLGPLREKFAEKERAYDSVEREALLAEAVAESGWQKKRDAADKLLGQVRVLQAEVKRAEESGRLFQPEIKALQPVVIEEITAKYRGAYAAKLSDLWLKLNAAAAVERELLSIQEEADLEINALFSGPQRARLTPTGRPDLTLLPQVGYPDFLAEFKKRSEMNGYKLD